MHECPPEADLQKFLTGSLPASRLDAVAAHLDVCDACQRSIEALGAAEPFLSEVADQLGRPTPEIDAALARVMAEVEDGVTTWVEHLGSGAGRRRGPSELPAGLLAKSDEPGLMGTLGTYRIQRVIGRGGMGVVLEARDPLLKRTVAIKVLAAHVAERPDAARLFVREARAAAAVTHENVVTVYAVDQANKIPYMVMEYVEGVSLEERIQEQGRLDLREVVRTGIQVASGLAAAHGRNLIHRDIKPGNILLEKKTRTAKISDFGLARAVDRATKSQSGLLVGTPEYMAPEQARGDAVDHRSDLFSLGSVLFAMCAGRTPFAAASTRAIINSVAEAVTDDVSELAPDTPGWLVELIERLHAENPAERYQSAGDVARVLREELLKMRGLTRTSGPVRSELDSPSRNPSPTRSHARPSFGRVLGWLREHWRVACVVALTLLVGGLVFDGTREQTTVVPTVPDSSGSPTVQTGPPAVSDGGGGGGLAGRTVGDRAGAFAVLSQGGGAGVRFATLAEAIAACGDGDAVVVDGDGPFRSGPINVGDKGITIKAAAGQRPVIHLATGRGEPSGSALIHSAGALRLEGIEFGREPGRGAVPSAGRLPDAIVIVESSRLEVINCRFVTAGLGVGIMAQRVSRCEIRNCEFLCLRGAAVDWFCPVGGRLELINCVQVGQVGLFVHPERSQFSDVSVVIDGSSFVAEKIVRLMLQGRPFRSRDKAGRVSWPITVSVSNSVLDAAGAVLEVDRSGDFRRDSGGGRPPDGIRWSGEGNLFLIGERMLSVRVQGRPISAPLAPRGLRDWERYWDGHERSALTARPDAEALSLHRRAVANLAAIAAESFRLPVSSPGRGTGPSGRDRGAFVERVGPGAGYEAWKQSSVDGR